VEISTAAAAARLGVSGRRVRKLIESGELRGHQLAGVWLVDAGDVATRLGSTPTRGRPWSERVSWGGLWLLSGLRPDWLSSVEIWRLRNRFEVLSAESLAMAVRRRTRVEQCRILPAYLDKIAAEAGVVAGGLTAAETVGADIVGLDLTEIYCDVATRNRLFDHFAIRATTDRANLIVRSIEDTELAPRLLNQRRDMPAAAVAVDLLESNDPRTVHAGADLATRLLTEFRHHG
jgi:excisionase family DNA binding protein